MKLRIMAAAGLVALSATGAAQAQPYGYYEFPGDPYTQGYYAPPSYDYYGSRHGQRYGPADPCAREAGNRALGWGLVGLLLGGLAGGAAAGAGVVAEGAGLGGVVGALAGSSAGSASAACGTARYSGLPVQAVTSSGVAIYGRPIYDYQSAYAPAPMHRGRPGGYERGRHDCCEEDRSYGYEQRSSHHAYRHYRREEHGEHQRRQYDDHGHDGRHYGYDHRHYGD